VTCTQLLLAYAADLALEPLSYDSVIFWQNIFRHIDLVVCLRARDRHFEKVQLLTFDL
jgi:hypothetical protein